MTNTVWENFELDTVIEGDWAEVSQKLPEGCVDLVVTSPPYYNAKPEYATWTSYEEYLACVRQWLAGVFRVLKPGRRAVWNVDDLLKSTDYHNCTPSVDSVVIAKNVGFTVRTPVLWNDPMNAVGWKPGTYPNGPSVVINHCVEFLWVFQKPRDMLKPVYYSRLPRELARFDVMDKDFLIRFARNQVWEVHAETRQPGHPAAFPEELVEPCIRMWSRPGEIVLDPFVGSGTTPVSALKWRRHYLGVERKPEYVKLARHRIRKREIELVTTQMILPQVPAPKQDKDRAEQIEMEV